MRPPDECARRRVRRAAHRRLFRQLVAPMSRADVPAKRVLVRLQGHFQVAHANADVIAILG